MSTPEAGSGSEIPSVETYLEQGTCPVDGQRVTVVKLEQADGMLVLPKYLDVRREGVSGATVGLVPGHGGEVWFVQHDPREGQDEVEVGVYSIAEIARSPADQAPQQ